MTKKIIWVMTLLVEILVPKMALSQKPEKNCDSASLSGTFNSISFMDSWDKTGPYFVKTSTPEKKITIKYGEINFTVEVENASDIRIAIIKSFGDILEIVIMDKVSYLFIKGIELRTLIPEIKKDDYFRTKVDGNTLVIEFKDETYGKYNLQNHTFCRTNKIHT